MKRTPEEDLAYLSAVIEHAMVVLDAGKKRIDAAKERADGPANDQATD